MLSRGPCAAALYRSRHISPKLLSFGLLTAGADTIRPSQQQGRDNKHKMDCHQPGEFLIIEIRIDVHERLEHLDRGNGNN
jgi:hypothetical protein